MKGTVFMDWIVPYVRTTQRAKWVSKDYKRYESWKTALRLKADLASIPRDLQSDKGYAIRVVVRWKKKARADLDNIIKGCLDGLFSQDRRVLAISAAAAENQGVESVEVVVT